MPPDQPRNDAAILEEIAAEIHRFLQSYPNNYAARALTSLVNRTAAGEDVDDDERELVLMTLIREAKAQARRKPFGPE